MPHIRVRGMTAPQVQELSAQLADELAVIINTTVDNFTFEQIASSFFANGRPDGGYPFIEVLWFERPTDVRQKTADHLTARVKRIVPNADVVVTFQTLDRGCYFENGRPF